MENRANDVVAHPESIDNWDEFCSQYTETDFHGYRERVCKSDGISYDGTRVCIYLRSCPCAQNK